MTRRAAAASPAHTVICRLHILPRGDWYGCRYGSGWKKNRIKSSMLCSARLAKYPSCPVGREHKDCGEQVRAHMAPSRLAIAVAASLLAWPACAQDRIGVVLMHGKQSAPQEHRELIDAIAAAGFAVEAPEMCWSARRIYDRPYG